MEGLAVRFHKGAGGNGEMPVLALNGRRNYGVSDRIDQHRRISSHLSVKIFQPVRVKICVLNIHIADFKFPVSAVSGHVIRRSHSLFALKPDLSDNLCAHSAVRSHIAAEKINPSVVLKQTADILPEILFSIVQH